MTSLDFPEFFKTFLIRPNLHSLHRTPQVRYTHTNVERTVYGRFWYLLVLWVTIGIGVPGCCGFFLNYGPSNLPIQLLQSSQMSAGPNSALGGRPPKNICYDERLKIVGTFILVDLQSTSMQKYLPTARA